MTTGAKYTLSSNYVAMCWIYLTRPYLMSSNCFVTGTREEKKKKHKNGGTTIMEASDVVQERDNSVVFGQFGVCYFLASGLSLFCFFSFQTFLLSTLFRCLSLSLSLSLKIFNLKIKKKPIWQLGIVYICKSWWPKF